MARPQFTQLSSMLINIVCPAPRIAHVITAGRRIDGTIPGREDPIRVSVGAASRRRCRGASYLWSTSYAEHEPGVAIGPYLRQFVGKKNDVAEGQAAGSDGLDQADAQRRAGHLRRGGGPDRAEQGVRGVLLLRRGGGGHVRPAAAGG
jgi:hypothetical protein